MPVDSRSNPSAVRAGDSCPRRSRPRAATHHGLRSMALWVFLAGVAALAGRPEEAPAQDPPQGEVLLLATISPLVLKTGDANSPVSVEALIWNGSSRTVTVAPPNGADYGLQIESVQDRAGGRVTNDRLDPGEPEADREYLPPLSTEFRTLAPGEYLTAQVPLWWYGMRWWDFPRSGVYGVVFSYRCPTKCRHEGRIVPTEQVGIRGYEGVLRSRPARMLALVGQSGRVVDREASPSNQPTLSS